MLYKKKINLFNNYMNIYMYKYKCPRWYGIESGLRNVYLDETLNEGDIQQTAEKDANNYTGSKTCSISLLQQFHMTIKPIKNYAALTSIPVSVFKNASISE